MAIWTSRYANKKLTENGWYPVGISLGSPKFSLGYVVRENCYSLAPKGWMLHLEEGKYRGAYMKKLDDIGEANIIRTVRGLESRAKAEGRELVLLCFEDVRKEGEWCHRRLFAEWWNTHTGEMIEELDGPTPVKLPKKAKTKEAKPEVKAPAPQENVEQLTLFSSAMY